MFILLLKKKNIFFRAKKEYIDLLIKRNLLDIGALVVIDETTEDTMFKFEKVQKKQVSSSRSQERRATM